MNRLQRKIAHLQNVLDTRYLSPPLPPLIDVHSEYMILKARPPPPIFEPIIEPIIEPPPPEVVSSPPEVEIPIIPEEPEVIDEFTDVPEEEIQQREDEQKALEDQLARLELEKLVKKKPRTKKL